MDIIKVIRSVEELIYEISLWFLMLPKTFFRTFNPLWIVNYVKTELQKEDKKQFDDFMSPMLLWILVVTVPAFIILKSFSVGIENDTVKELVEKSLEMKILLVSTFLIISPLTFAVLLQKMAKRPITKQDLKENFYIQIYAFVPVQSLTIFGFLSMVTIVAEIDTVFESVLSVLYLLTTFIGALYWYWFFYCEIYIIKKTLHAGWWRAIILFLGFSTIAYIMTILVIMFLLSLVIPDITKVL